MKVPAFIQYIDVGISTVCSSHCRVACAGRVSICQNKLSLARTVGLKFKNRGNRKTRRKKSCTSFAVVAFRTFFGTRAQDRVVRAARLHGNNDIRCVDGSSTLRLALLYRNMQTTPKDVLFRLIWKQILSRKLIQSSASMAIAN